MLLQYGNIAGWPFYYACGLRRMGYNSTSIKPQYEEYGGYGKSIVLKRELPSDHVIFRKNDLKAVKILKAVKTFLSHVNTVDLVHYYGQTIFPNALDAYIFLKMKVPTIISWAGGDARIVELAKKNNPFFYRDLNYEWDNTVRKRLSKLSKLVTAVATDPELADYSRLYFDRVFILRQPVDLEFYHYSKPINKIPVLLHIPTSPEVKGTKHIIQAVERLKSEKMEFEFKMLEAKYTQVQIRELISQADVYVDELRCGAHGQTAVEAMALGKPTITFIREDLVDKYPSEIPIINANPDTIYKKLKEIILDQEMRIRLSKASRLYIEKYHSLEVVCRDLLDIYKACGLKLN